MRLKVPRGILKLRVSLLVACVAFLLTTMPAMVSAATLLLSPSTGVYSLNSTFKVKVVVNSDGKPVNAAEGTIKFNPKELSVVSVDRTSSVFNLWVAEPSFSNSAGTISFSGGSPTGYTGSAGTVFTITFKSVTAGQNRVSYTNGSVLANDGRGTNILSGMNGGTYTIEVATSQPDPEVVIEYVAPANTPAAPKLVSSTHGDQTAWYTANQAELSWTLPAGVTEVRTLLDTRPSSIPTKVYETPIREITLTDLDDGESYFHIQFRNADGWGKVAHYRLGVDTKKPESFSVERSTSTDLANPVQTLLFVNSEASEASPIVKYRIVVDSQEPIEFVDAEKKSQFEISSLAPGYHTVVVEAFDAAGNSSVDSISFTVESFEPPQFTEYPREVTADVIPVMRGATRPGASVTVYLEKFGSEPRTYSITADEQGVFTFIPEGAFTEGVYEIHAIAKDVYGAESMSSEKIRVAVQKPGYIRIGSLLVSVLSVLLPLVALLALLVLSLWWLLLRIRRFRGRVSRESKEVVAIVAREFSTLGLVLATEKEKLLSQKKTKKFTITEEAFFTSLDSALRDMQDRIEKEAQDVEDLIQK
jgi:Bacterial Ig-like domain/Cohesin domain